MSILPSILCCHGLFMVAKSRCATCTLGAALVSPDLFPDVRATPPLLIGHRGTRGRLPENSLEAFQAALEAGLDGVEFDVQRSRDGHLLIYHNFELADGRLARSLHLSGNCSASTPISLA